MDTCIHCGVDTGDACAWFLIYERRMKENEQEIDRLNGLLIRQAAVIEKIQDERDALKDALLMIRNDYSAPGSELEADINAAIDAAREG